MTTGKRATKLCPDKDRTRFGEITYGNHIVFSIDGQETFKLIYDEINRAQNSIYIAGYDLDPSLSFIREKAQSSGNVTVGNSTKGGDSRLRNPKSYKSNRENAVT